MATRKTAPKKNAKATTKRAAKTDFASNLRAQVEDVWMTSLGVVANAQEHANRVIENVMTQSKSLQERVVESADEVKARVEARVAELRDAEMIERVNARVAKVGHLVEARAADALSRAGIATKKDVQTLSRRVSKLGAEVEKLVAMKKVAAKPVAKAAKPVVKRAAKPVAAPAEATA